MLRTEDSEERRRPNGDGRFEECNRAYLVLGLIVFSSAAVVLAVGSDTFTYERRGKHFDTVH